jgi:hypothetical protein
VEKEVGGWRDKIDKRHGEREMILKRGRERSEFLAIPGRKRLRDLKEKMSTRVRLRGGQGMDVDSDMELDQDAEDEDEDEDMSSEDEFEDEMNSENVAVLGSNERMNIDIKEDDVDMEDSQQPTTVVTLSEATARRAVNRSISLLDED